MEEHRCAIVPSAFRRSSTDDAHLHEINEIFPISSLIIIACQSTVHPWETMTDYHLHLQTALPIPSIPSLPKPNPTGKETATGSRESACRIRKAKATQHTTVSTNTCIATERRTSM
jgi:hypothetical protein